MSAEDRVEGRKSSLNRILKTSLRKSILLSDMIYKK